MKRQLLLLALVGMLLLAIDVVSKWATQAYLPHMAQSVAAYPHGGIGIFSNFLGIELSITHATNTGAVWGVFAGYQYALLALRMVLIVALIGYLTLSTRNRLPKWPLMMIIAGAVGNVVDIFLYGHVVDMIHFRFWSWSYPQLTDVSPLTMERNFPST